MSPGAKSSWSIDYGIELEDEIGRIQQVIESHAQIASMYEPRWLALNLLEGESDIAGQLEDYEGGEELQETLQASLTTLASKLPNGVQIAIADKRYAFVNTIIASSLSQPESRASLSERVDRLVTSPWLGFPIFLIVMYLVFNLVVNVSAPYLDWIDSAIGGPITSWVRSLLLLISAPVWLKGLVLDGIIAGVGGVLVFVPGLIALFLFIAILEDSGYLARAAFVMHRLMGRIGLSGKSFVALILGFGCAVPAIYATRTLDSFRERVLTGLLVPLMSCAARLPVYVGFGIAFFGKNADIVVWRLYALGIRIATITAWLLSKTILRKDEQNTSFLLELPSYRLPSLRSLWFYVSQRTGGFLQNAGTVILAASVVIWLLLSLPLGVRDLRQSWFGEISAVIAPVLEPAGFGTWETSGSVITGLVAKEVVVSTMSQIYTGSDAVDDDTVIGMGEGMLEIGKGFLTATRDAAVAMAETLTPFIPLTIATQEPDIDTELGLALQRVFTPLSALAFLVFVLLYVPCMATLGTIRSEFGTRWAVFSALYQTGVACAVSVVVFQIGLILGYV
jgi:ferrous iron transport protein B